MKFTEENIYHVYNRGNNKQQIFFNSDNYLFFIKKIRHFLNPHCNILAYCLMPNHFHFLIHIPLAKNTHSAPHHPLVRAMASLLSSYAQAINKQNNTTGNLFQQKTKSKCLTENEIKQNASFILMDYSTTCFHYIHQNPLKATLVMKLEEWPYSSFPDYAGIRNGTLCNRDLAYQLLNISPDKSLIDFRVPEDIVSELF